MELDMNLISDAQRGSYTSRNALLLRYIPLIKKLSKSYPKNVRGDLLSEGTLGVIHAIDKFDVDKGVSFATYASYWIRHKFQKYYIDHRMPFKNITDNISRKIFFKMKTDNVHNSSSTQLKQYASEMNITEKQLNNRMNIVFTKEDNTALDKLASDARYYEKFFHSSMLDNVKNVISTSLDDRACKILEMRYNGATLKDIATTYSISIERTRQIVNSSLEKIKANIN